MGNDKRLVCGKFGTLSFTSVLSTDARNDNQRRSRKTAALRRQSDDSSRIDRDALGRFGGGESTLVGPSSVREIGSFAACLTSHRYLVLSAASRGLS